MRLKILFFILLGVTWGAADVDMVMSFMSMDERPVSVLMPHICWGYYKLKTFTKKLCDAGIPFAYSLQQNRTEFYLQHVIFLADLSCPGTDRFLEKANEAELFKSPYRWLILSAGDLTVLEKLSLLIDSDVIVAQRGDVHTFFFIEGAEPAEKTYPVTPRTKTRGFHIPHIVHMLTGRFILCISCVILDESLQILQQMRC